MQLKNVSGLLATAACSLLTQNAQAESSFFENWQIETALMLYSEVDRVSAAEAVIAVKKEYKDEHFISSKLVVDALTGASATGAVPQPYAQTFTRPSGRDQYQVDANDTPLDDTFRDTRVQINGQWTAPLTNNITQSYGGQLSKEYDYLSVSINGSLAINTNFNNTTYSIGASYSLDEFKPEGGIPVPFSRHVNDANLFADKLNFKQVYNDSRLMSSDDKQVFDIIAGVTQVWTKRWLTTVNVGLSKVDGYQTDPFKVVSRVDNQGYLIENIYEQRPDSRNKQSFFANSKYHFERSVLDLSYRYATDDWDVNSHTLEGRWHYPLSNTGYLQPHVRYYQQAAANFYQPFINEQEVLPNFVSADYRIGELATYTLGLKYGNTTSGGHPYALRLEYYYQSPEDVGKTRPGVLAQQDLYPSLSAIVLQYSYQF